MAANAAFRTTHWSVILEAARSRPFESQEAFSRIYLDYWHPLYVYIRRRGYSPPDAEDIAQNFFVHLIENRALAGLERNGGRFRSFLLRSLDNFLANEWDRARALKRGGGAVPLSLDAEGSEACYMIAQAETETPETVFERQWVLTLLTRVLDSLAAECAASGKGGLFEDLRPHLQSDRRGGYTELAARHGTTEGAIKVTVHRFRQRYGELLRQEIARTVGSPGEVDQELQHLMAVMGR